MPGVTGPGPQASPDPSQHRNPNPGEEGLALRGPHGPPEQPGPSPGQAVPNAKEQPPEGATAADLALGAWRLQVWPPRPAPRIALRIACGHSDTVPSQTSQ